MKDAHETQPERGPWPHDASIGLAGHSPQLPQQRYARFGPSQFGTKGAAFERQCQAGSSADSEGPAIRLWRPAFARTRASNRIFPGGQPMPRWATSSAAARSPASWQRICRPGHLAHRGSHKIGRPHPDELDESDTDAAIGITVAIGINHTDAIKQCDPVPQPIVRASRRSNGEGIMPGCGRGCSFVPNWPTSTMNRGARPHATFARLSQFPAARRRWPR